MKFLLNYRGPLKSNGKPKDKHELRKHFHPQLEDLWTRLPLREQAEEFLDPEYELTAVKTVGNKRFSALVNSRNDLIASLDILMLRPEEPGSVVTQGGDIDNRIKTLLDALSVPNADQLVDDPDCSDRINHCLLEDDNLITNLGVRVNRLLGSSDTNEVLLIISVEVNATRGTFKNLAINVNGNA